MQLIRDVNLIPQSCKGAVVALGNFDGVHLGHQAILAHAKELARQSGKAFAVLTFEPHPREFLGGKKESLRIYPFRRKAELLRECGADYLIALRFNKALSSMSAEDFITQILHGAIGVSHVISGFNFHFGKDRKGDKEFLAARAAELGFGYTAHTAVVDKLGQPISSSRIRSSLKTGDVKSAAIQLGRPYSVCGRIIHGDKRGTNIGFPTANVRPTQLFLPRHGVYAVKATLANGAPVKGVANLGRRPTFRTHTLLLETHFFDFSGSIYGMRLDIDLMGFIREEKEFADIAALRSQIQKDVAAARVIAQRTEKL